MNRAGAVAPGKGRKRQTWQTSVEWRAIEGVRQRRSGELLHEGFNGLVLVLNGPHQRELHKGTVEI